MVWVDSTLGEICDIGGGEIKTGPFGSQLHQSDYEEFGTPVVMPKDIIEGRVDETGIARVNENHVERLSQHKLKLGDIVYGRRGDIGRQALTRQENVGWLCGTGCLKISLGHQSPIDSRYLHLYLKQDDVVSWIANQAIGATMPNLNTSILRNIPVRYPAKLEEQLKVVNTLFAYDNLIENNTRRLAILETIAQNLYREWFINFRFPNHAQTQWQDTPQGKIPMGWETKPFTDMADVLGGGTPSTKEPEYWNGDIKFFAPKDAPDSFYVMDTEKSITSKGVQKSSTKVYPKDTVFITARGTVGKVVLPAEEMAMNQSCYALRMKSGKNQRFLFLLTKEQVAYLKKNTGGATFDTIVTDTFKAMHVTVPPLDLIKEFETLANPIFEQILCLLRKNKNLKQQRDMLLSKLI